MASTVAVTHVKCKSSASLLPNNLATNPTSIAYLHRNEVHIALQSDLKGERAQTSVVAYTERDPVSGMCFAKFGSTSVVVLINLAGTVFIFDQTGQRVLSQLALVPKDKGPRAARLQGIATDGKILCIGSGNGSVYVLEVDSSATLTLRKEIEQPKGSVMSLCMSDGGVVSGDESGAVVLWDTKKGVPIMAWSETAGPCVSLCAGHGFIVGGFASGHVRIFGLKENRIIAEICAHTRVINAVAMHPVHALFACCSEDTFVSVWSLPTGKKLDAGIANTMLVSPNSSLLTGVGFVGNHVVCTAYDSRYLSFMKLP